MKKFTLLIVCLIASMATTFAQRCGDKSVVFKLNYASDTSFGIGTRFQYNITDQIRVEPEFNYYFEHDYVSFWDMGVNAAYLFPIASDVTLYPLAGIGYAHFDGNGCDGCSDGRFQAKFGAGAEFQLVPKVKVVIEPKFQLVDDSNQFVITAGIAYCF